MEYAYKRRLHRREFEAVVGLAESMAGLRFLFDIACPASGEGNITIT